MPWASFLLALVSVFVVSKLLGLTNNRGRLKFLGLTIAAAIFTLMQLLVFTNSVTDNASFAAATNFVIEWGHVTCLALILSSLAVFIRESKPGFAQFPMLYTAFPLLIVISYILVNDTYAIKRWLLTIYQGGAIVVSLLMYGVYTYKRNDYMLVLSGVVIFLMAHILFWYIPGISESYQWIWKALIGVAMITTVLGYEQADPKVAATSKEDN